MRIITWISRINLVEEFLDLKMVEGQAWGIGYECGILVEEKANQDQVAVKDARKPLSFGIKQKTKNKVGESCGSSLWIEIGKQEGKLEGQSQCKGGKVRKEVQMSVNCGYFQLSIGDHNTSKCKSILSKNSKPKPTYAFYTTLRLILDKKRHNGVAGGIEEGYLSSSSDSDRGPFGNYIMSRGECSSFRNNSVEEQYIERGLEHNIMGLAKDGQRNGLDHNSGPTMFSEGSSSADGSQGDLKDRCESDPRGVGLQVGLSGGLEPISYLVSREASWE